MEHVFMIMAIIALMPGIVMSPFLMLRFKWGEQGPMIWLIKSYAAALASWFTVIALCCGLTGIIIQSTIVMAFSAYSVIVYLGYLVRIGLVGYEDIMTPVFGRDWLAHISLKMSGLFLKRPVGFRLPKNENFVLEQDIVFAASPGSDRQLLCDVWQPAQNVQRSGMAFIYLHGGAWYYLDKDFSTRTLFKRLASQGHVVMDVEYRLFPETDMTGMVQDAKRAIAWLRANSERFGINPKKIVIGGGSAGGHIALMAAYLPEESKLCPSELHNADLSVAAVVGLYAPPDLNALYYHTGQQNARKRSSRNTDQKRSEMPEWIKKLLGQNYFRLGLHKSPADAGALSTILGCTPDQCPELYDYYSPLYHVHKNCPPTLLLQGEHDMFTPVLKTRSLYRKLQAIGIPSVMRILPGTDHAFDLFLPTHSMAARIAIYDIERFLAMISVASVSKKMNPQNVISTCTTN